MSRDVTLTGLSLRDMRQGLDRGDFSARDLVEAHLARIAEADGALGAFVHTDPGGARQAAASVGGPLGGIPFAIKDVLDTADMPTEMGSKIYRGHQPRFDAGCVALARAAGAIALGKTATAEFAGTAPAATVNPWNPAHTPGGSSSGSAAAVAARMAAFAFGTQTGGSVLRPAAFCGIAGFKPTQGVYPISGMLAAAHSFDTVGLFARDTADIAIVHAALTNGTTARTAQAADLKIGLCRTHLWDTVDTPARDALAGAAAALTAAGAALSDLTLPDGFSELTQHRAVVNAFERHGNMAGESVASDRFQPKSRAVAEKGADITADAYLAARRELDRWRVETASIFAGTDLILAPVTPGEAPEGIESTGDPRLQEIWTMLQFPSVSVPWGRGPSGLPLGVQLIAPRFDDARLLSGARLLEELRAP
ncbi:amidase [Salipiger sp. P9]|uniref:amidase n=1 Tax=Salipiger pentaromativorans TaxID=2943193 RepID=UPI00215848AE|nr:amidase [Salipiger pentaromativorans]MCR8549223.1 amidase [Salipiger pentaromativorans]